ncbi:MAG: helix-turn-helix transcriptional regulator [Eubacterium sp.]|nr:helix-turn-helix transcriptional regulator [Eubacterium sp.]
MLERKVKYMDNLNQKIGARLRCVREEAGFTVKQVAELLGISESHYRRIENGHHTLVPEKIITLYTYMNVDPLFLLTGERRMESSGYALGDRFRDRQTVVMEELMDYCSSRSGTGKTAEGED